MVLAIFDNNDLDFAVKFKDVSQKEKVKKYMIAGLAAWYAAAHCDEDDEDYEYFTRKEIESFYGSGYAEPTMELLERNGIEAEIISVQYDEDGQAHVYDNDGNELEVDEAFGY